MLDATKIAAMNGAACRVINATAFVLHPTLTQAQLQLPWTQQVTGALTLAHNARITSLAGLKNLTTVTGVLTIRNLTQLPSVSLPALHQVGSLVVAGNAQLVSLAGLPLLSKATAGAVSITVRLCVVCAGRGRTACLRVCLRACALACVACVHARIAVCAAPRGWLSGGVRSLTLLMVCQGNTVLANVSLELTSVAGALAIQVSPPRNC